MDSDDNDFDPVDWRNDAHEASSSKPPPPPSGESQAGDNADKLDVAGVKDGRIDCQVSEPQKENDGTKDAFVSYLVSTDTDFPTFQSGHVGVRRRFTDFVFLYKSLVREFPACAVPPLPDKHKMGIRSSSNFILPRTRLTFAEYVRGDRFGNDFTFRRAYSLHRFLKRLTLHPILRKTSLLCIFLESPDWNAHMRSRPLRVSTSNDNGVFDGLTDSFLNAFSKVHKPDRRFIEVRDRADKLDEDLTHVEKIFSRVIRRENDLEADYADLSLQFQKIIPLEPNLEMPIHTFAEGVEAASQGMRELKEHTDQNYLVSLRDMEAYIVAVRNLLKLREQKQLDYEGLTEYLAKAAYERDQLASAPAYSSSNFFRAKVEDMRGVNHEASRQERVKKLETRIRELTNEAEQARITTEAFDEEVVREIADFERIKSSEMRDTLGDLAGAHMEFYSGQVKVWEAMLAEAERM